MAGKAVNGTSDDGERTGSVTRSVRGHGKKGSAASASVNGSGKSRSRYAKKAAAPSPIVTQEMIEAERALLLAEKQAQLEEVLDRHDDLIRECFHMEHFRLMASFNPVESKQDNSPVFREVRCILAASIHRPLQSLTSINPNMTWSNMLLLLRAHHVKHAGLTTNVKRLSPQHPRYLRLLLSVRQRSRRRN